MAFRDGKNTCVLCDQSSPTPVFPTTLEADCPAYVEVRHVVYFTGDPVFGIFQVDKVDVALLSTMPGKAIVVAKSSSTRCTIQLDGVATIPGLVSNTLYFIGFDSKIAPGPPQPTGTARAWTQEVGWAISPSQLFIRWSSLRGRRGPLA
jgi:hypothetical protein